MPTESQLLHMNQHTLGQHSLQHRDGALAREGTWTGHGEHLLRSDYRSHAHEGSPQLIYKLISHSFRTAFLSPFQNAYSSG